MRISRQRALAAAMFAPLTTGLLLVVSPPPAQASSPFQGDCGTITCTVRLDRAQTRNARDAGAVIGIVAGACASVSLGTLAPVCGAAVAPAAAITALAAARFYEQGDCLQIKFSKVPGPGGVPVAIPGSVRRGTRNCN
jgi:hypothetical protein